MSVINEQNIQMLYDAVKKLNESNTEILKILRILSERVAAHEQQIEKLWGTRSPI